MACSPTMSSRPLADTQRRSLGVAKSHCVTIGIPGQASDAARGRHTVWRVRPASRAMVAMGPVERPPKRPTVGRQPSAGRRALPTLSPCLPLHPLLVEFPSREWPSEGCRPKAL